MNALAVYVGRARDFDRADWFKYTTWVGGMLAGTAILFAFLALGASNGVAFPATAWLVPIGALVFCAAIAVDTIGHLTVYKEALRGGEALVHRVTIANGVGSCALLLLSHRVPALLIPAAVLTVLSVFYSVVDEVFHWRRYATAQSDPVEMASHAVILVGHGIMMASWWAYVLAGSAGADETLALLFG